MLPVYGAILKAAGDQPGTPAGTVMVFEGRLLHGTGVNKSTAPRAILVMNSVKSFMRQQELHMLSARADVLKNASPKLLYRLGALPSKLGYAEGTSDEYQVNHRLALESGRYEPVGALTPDDVDALGAPFTYRESSTARRQFEHQPETLDEVRKRYANLRPAWEAARTLSAGVIDRQMLTDRSLKMQSSNRRIVFSAPQTVEVQQEEVGSGDLGADELLVESICSAVSAGTELACLAGLEEWFPFPGVPGYATVGRVVALGGSVTGLREGEVVLHYGGHQSCNRRTLGDFLLPVPAGVDAKVAAMTRLATVAFTGIRVSDIKAGDFVAVAGLGAVGNLAAQLAQIQGGRVIGVEMSAGRIDLARQCGLEQTIDASREDAAERIRELTGGQGAATVIDTTGDARAIVAEMDWVAERGELILLGTPRGEVRGDLTELLRGVHLWPRGCVTLKGAHEWRYPAMHDPNTKHSLERNSRVAWWLQQTGRLQMHKLITHVARPEDAPAVYEALATRKDEYVGVVFDWS